MWCLCPDAAAAAEATARRQAAACAAVAVSPDSMTAARRQQALAQYDAGVPARTSNRAEDAPNSSMQHFALPGAAVGHAEPGARHVQWQGDHPAYSTSCTGVGRQAVPEMQSRVKAVPGTQEAGSIPAQYFRLPQQSWAATNHRWAAAVVCKPFECLPNSWPRPAVPVATTHRSAMQALLPWKCQEQCCRPSAVCPACCQQTHVVIHSFLQSVLPSSLTVTWLRLLPQQQLPDN